MAKKIIAVFCALTVLLCGCGRKVGENFTESDRFVVVSGDNCNAPYHETVIADKETGVLYIVVLLGINSGFHHLLIKTERLCYGRRVTNMVLIDMEEG